MAKQRLLVAATTMGFAHAKRALHRRFDLVPVFSLAAALRLLEGEAFDAILCSIHFDESRMFDLLREWRQLAPGTPFICCQIVHSPLSPSVIRGMLTSARSLGCSGFVDYHEMHRTQRAAQADRGFCEAVSALLQPAMLEPRSAGR
jgi:CheY-like chemotaxis protein